MLPIPSLLLMYKKTLALIFREEWGGGGREGRAGKGEMDKGGRGGREGGEHIFC